jgi:hypothetical protein
VEEEKNSMMAQGLGTGCRDALKEIGIHLFQYPREKDEIGPCVRFVRSLRPCALCGM